MANLLSVGVASGVPNSGTGTVSTLDATIGYSYAHISTSTTTVVKSGAGYLYSIIINQVGTVASTATIYDNTAGSGTIIGILDTLSTREQFLYNIAFGTGLTIVTTGTVAPDLTICWR
jgi:hypothetical protein